MSNVQYLRRHQLVGKEGGEGGKFPGRNRRNYSENPPGIRQEGSSGGWMGYWTPPGVGQEKLERANRRVSCKWKTRKKRSLMDRWIDHPAAHLIVTSTRRRYNWCQSFRYSLTFGSFSSPSSPSSSSSSSLPLLALFPSHHRPGPSDSQTIEERRRKCRFIYSSLFVSLRLSLS